MVRVPKFVTFCGDCKRDNVGVVVDWSKRDEANPRYRKARHSIEYQTEGSPMCVGSRNIVPKELIFENEAVKS